MLFRNHSGCYRSHWYSLYDGNFVRPYCKKCAPAFRKLYSGKLQYLRREQSNKISISLPKILFHLGTIFGQTSHWAILLSRIVELASEKNGESLVLTFFPHPRMVLRPEEHGVELLSTTTEKVDLLRESGINHLVIHPFSRDFSAMSASQFIQTIIAQKLQASKLVIGYDHRFGNQRAGSISELRLSGQKLGFEVEEIPEQDIDAIAISSTRIRKALKDGRVGEAAALLGRPYSLSGIVVRGNRIGHSIGFPTANIRIPESYKLIPSEGVYLARFGFGGKSFHSMVSIGRRPTLESNGKLSIEAHVLDFRVLIS